MSGGGSGESASGGAGTGGAAGASAAAGGDGGVWSALLNKSMRKSKEINSTLVVLGKERQ